MLVLPTIQMVRSLDFLLTSTANYYVLTHIPMDKMAAFLQTAFSDAFPRMESFVFWL